MRDGCLVDTHDHPVYPEVWELYEHVLQHIGPRPTLIEWDADIPALSVLMGEATKAQQRMEKLLCLLLNEDLSELGRCHSARRGAFVTADRRSATRIIPSTVAMEVYRNNYHGNLHDTLAGAYPVIEQLVGKDFFRLHDKEIH